MMVLIDLKTYLIWSMVYGNNLTISFQGALKILLQFKAYFLPPKILDTFLLLFVSHFHILHGSKHYQYIILQFWVSIIRIEYYGAKIHILAGPHSFVEASKSNLACGSFLHYENTTFQSVLPLFSHSEPPASSCKGLCGYIRPTQVIQDNLSICRFLSQLQMQVRDIRMANMHVKYGSRHW
jgi:hypothetical protein